MKDAIKSFASRGSSSLKRVQGSLGIARASGSIYLQEHFGLLPLIGDLSDLIANIIKTDARLRQLARDNGSWVRRKGTVTHTESTSVSTQTGSGGNSFIYPTIHVGLWKTGAKAVRNIEVDTSTRYWFSGCFKYWIDPMRLGAKTIPVRERFQLERILYGVDPTDIATIYELMPWSWLVYWVSPLGSVIDNISNDAADNLVAKYAYIMAHSVSHEKVRVDSDTIRGPVSLFSSSLTETKQRYIAGPYGFGIDFSGLSPKQLAILASLGLSKLNSN
jgi:hypothetical protein